MTSDRFVTPALRGEVPVVDFPSVSFADILITKKLEKPEGLSQDHIRGSPSAVAGQQPGFECYPNVVNAYQAFPFLGDTATVFFADGRLLLPLLFLLLLASSLSLFSPPSCSSSSSPPPLSPSLSPSPPPSVVAFPRSSPPQNPISKSSTSYNILYHRLETLASNSSSVLS